MVQSHMPLIMESGRKRDWQSEFCGEVERVERGGERPPLLLHACCAPCTSGVLDRLVRAFQVIVFYYNPNIAPKEEYERRLYELKRFLSLYPVAVQNGVLLEIENGEYEEWEEAAGLHENSALFYETERGERCKRCCAMRLKKTAKRGRELGVAYFATTLTLSPHKDANAINEEGLKINKIALQEEREGGIKYLVSDFKKKDGFLKSLKMSEEYGLYRQQYCGCKCSMRQELRTRCFDAVNNLCHKY